MKSKRKAVLLAIRESIEMELFSSEERCVVTPAQEWKEEDNYCFHRVNVSLKKFKLQENCSESQDCCVH